MSESPGECHPWPQAGPPPGPVPKFSTNNYSGRHPCSSTPTATGSLHPNHRQIPAPLTAIPFPTPFPTPKGRPAGYQRTVPPTLPRASGAASTASTLGPTVGSRCHSKHLDMASWLLFLQPSGTEAIIAFLYRWVN